MPSVYNAVCNGNKNSYFGFLLAIYDWPAWSNLNVKPGSICGWQWNIGRFPFSYVTDSKQSKHYPDTDKEGYARPYGPTVVLLTEEEKDRADRKRDENPRDDLVSGIKEEGAQFHLPPSIALAILRLVFGIGVLTGVIVTFRYCIRSSATRSPQQ
ncbi:MAG: hypothetical protein QOI07_200 [Verrucomicrobiota bacterium]|jgi:hypothetical protein